MMQGRQTRSDSTEPGVRADDAFRAIHDALAGGRLEQAVAAREVLHMPGLVSGFAHELPSMADLELALEQKAFSPGHLKIYSGRNPVDPARFRIVRGETINPQVVAGVARMDTTMLFNHVQRRVVKAHRLACLMEEWLGDPVSIAMISSFGCTSGLPVHHDEEELLVIQLAGAKTWTFHGPPVEPGLKNFEPVDDDGPLVELTTVPGDVLYVPAGQRHCCHASGNSLHLGVVIENPDGRFLSEKLADLIASDPQLCEPAKAILGAESDARMAEQYRARLHQLVDILEIDKLLSHRRRDLMIARSIVLGHHEG